VAFAIALCCLAGHASANDARIVSIEPVTDRVLTLTIQTPAFAEGETKVDVYLPPGYRDDHSKRWPVTYYTAGTSNNYDTFFQQGGEELTADYGSILVSPDANNGYWSDWYNAGDFGPPRYETYVTKQLIPLIDEHFRTIPRRSQRAIFGVSMGGYGAMMLASRHPQLFVGAATISGAVDSNLPVNGAVLSFSSTLDGAPPDAILGPRSTQEVRWHGHNPTDLAGNLRGVDVQVRTANGTPSSELGETGDPTAVASCVLEQGVHMASVDYHEALAALKVPHLWKDYGPGCHTVVSTFRQITDTLTRFGHLFAKPPRRPLRFDHASIESRFSVWNWTVKADPDRAVEFLRLQGAGRHGVVLTGSGMTRVRTPPDYRRAERVKLKTAGESRWLKPSRRGRLTFSVDLGPPHADQQFTDAARAAGAGRPGYFRTVKVQLDPPR